MAKALKSEKVGAVGNIQINPQTRLVDHAGVAFDLEGVPFHARKNRKRKADISRKEWPAVTAACMGIDRELFMEFGGFDSIYRNGAEDIDLCLRLNKADTATSFATKRHLSSRQQFPWTPRIQRAQPSSRALVCI